MIQANGHWSGRSKVVSGYRGAEKSMLKPTLALTTLLFLLLAPEPDSQDIAELTAYFLVPANHSVLFASNEPAGP